MATTTAHSEAPHGNSGFPPFDAEYFPSQLVWLTVSFVLLYALMARVALPRTASILADRSKHVGDDIETANRFKQRSEAVNAAHEKALSDAHDRAQGIANAAHGQQAAAAEVTNKGLEAHLHGRLAAAEQSIAASRAAAMGKIDSIASDTAGAIVEHLVGRMPDRREVTAAVAEVLKR
jgi:F-type H+-transporting ATPase subunit b